MPMCRIRITLQDSHALELWADYPSTFDALLSFLSMGLNVKSLSVSPLSKVTAMTQTTQTPTPAPVATVKATTHRYTCEQLGVCQQLDLACTGCKPFATREHPFAPGTITTDPAGMLPGDKSDRRSLVKYMLISCGMVALTMVASFAFGLWVGSK